MGCSVSGPILLLIPISIPLYTGVCVRTVLRAAELALAQYSQGASDYTRVLNTQTALLQQQDTLTAARGQVISKLIATYKALGGGWQLRDGNNYVRPDIIDAMIERRTDWGELLTSPEQAESANK